MHTLHCDEWVGADCLRSDSMWTAEMQGSNPPVFGDEFIDQGKTSFA